jgi:Hg(II)-responsive transcriptional regulator
LKSGPYTQRCRRLGKVTGRVAGLLPFCACSRESSLDSVVRYGVHNREVKSLTIGQLAREAGVNLESIRFYETRGLVPEPPRSRTGYRLYAQDTVRRIRFIKRAQELGFSLHEIGELLALRADPHASGANIRDRAIAKIRGIAEKIADLERIKVHLEQLAAACSGCGSVEHCPIIESLDSNPNQPPKEDCNGTQTR